MANPLAGVQSLLNAVFGRSARTVVPSVDGTQGPPRMDRRNELVVKSIWNTIHQLADEGSLFVATTATPGTGVTLTSATGTTYSDTQAIFGVQNQDTTQSLNGVGKDHIPLWLKLVITAAGTAGTDDHYALRLDKALRLSGGSASYGVGSATVNLNVANVNPSYPAGDEVSQIFVGAPTVAAATQAVRTVGRAEGRKAAAPAYIVGDVITFLFGAVEQVQAQAITPTSAIGLVLPMPAVIVPPGWSMVLNEWMTARTAAQSAEIEYGYALR